MRVLPPAELAPFVHHFWLLCWALHTPYTAEALAHPSAHIALKEENGARRAEVSGVRTQRFARRLVGEGQVFGITFRPAMFQPLLRASMASLTDRVIPLARLLGPGVAAWARAIHAEPELEAKIAIATSFLAPRLPAARPQVVQMRDLVERIGNDRSLLSVEDASEAVSLGVRALQRHFRRYVGVSPKWVIQRFRLLEAGEQLRGRRPPTLAALAASLGYADQAHFARAFKVTVGQTPKAFVLARSNRERG